MQWIKDHKTPYLIDPFHYLGSKRKRLLDSCWAGVFRRYIRPILPVHLLAGHFSPDIGRPTNELVAMMGVMILQQMHDLTDDEGDPGAILLQHPVILCLRHHHRE